MDQFMRVKLIPLLCCSMALVLRFIQTGQNMSVLGKKVELKEKASLPMLVATPMKVR